MNQETLNHEMDAYIQTMYNEGKIEVKNLELAREIYREAFNKGLSIIDNQQEESESMEETIENLYGRQERYDQPLESYLRITALDNAVRMGSINAETAAMNAEVFYKFLKGE